jgi:putative methionine-R-sulfoxide reductase with GAF domain
VGGPALTAPDRITPEDWLRTLPALAAEALARPDFEAALGAVTDAACVRLGDRAAGRREGALLPGERDYRVSGVFLIAPDRRYNVLVANHGFPPEQRRLSIPIAWNHPGRVVASERFLLLENTDEHRDFRQFLRTSRMGSSIYMPVFAGGAMIGQIVAAAQARGTYGPADVAPMQALAGVVALLWEAKDGAAWWAADYPAPDAWYADAQGAVT